MRRIYRGGKCPSAKSLKRSTPDQNLVDAYLSDALKERDFVPCELFKDGQEFVTERLATMPENFCGWAWAGIEREVTAVMLGGDYPWMKQPGTVITCCTDAFRPVVFKVERID